LSHNTHDEFQFAVAILRMLENSLETSICDFLLCTSHLHIMHWSYVVNYVFA